MASYVDTCKMCGQFRNSDVERREFCSVGCAADATSPTVPQFEPGRSLTETPRKDRDP